MWENLNRLVGFTLMATKSMDVRAVIIFLTFERRWWERLSSLDQNEMKFNTSAYETPKRIQESP
jgi:hypothetical protein